MTQLLDRTCAEDVNCQLSTANCQAGSSGSELHIERDAGAAPGSDHTLNVVALQTGLQA